MSIVPPRWLPLLRYFEILFAPILDLDPGTGGRWVPVEANGPDGKPWTSLQPVTVSLGQADPIAGLVRVVAILSGASRGQPDPGPVGPRGRGMYYAPCSLLRPRRADEAVAALAGLLLDIDDRSVGSRAGAHRRLGLLPVPTAVIHSGGGVQAAFVFREALVFDRADPVQLEVMVRRYLRVAVALERLTGADETWWPSHLYRCPATYHLKVPSRPVLVGVDLSPERRFNLADFDAQADAVGADEVEPHVEKLVDRLMGRPRRARGVLAPAPLATRVGTDGRKHMALPHRVSAATVELLNTGRHPKYERHDGSLDRSRAVCAAATSLLGAGLSEEEAASVIAASALRSALEDRGDHALSWLSHQVAAARGYLAESRGTRRRS